MCLIWLANGLAMIIVKLQDNTVIVLTHVNTCYILHIFLVQLQLVTTVQSMFQPLSLIDTRSPDLLSVFCSHLSYSCLHPSPSLLLHVPNCFLLIVFILYFYFRCSPTVHALTKNYFLVKLPGKWVPKRKVVLSLLHLGTLREPQGRWLQTVVAGQ